VLAQLVVEPLEDEITAPRTRDIIDVSADEQFVDDATVVGRVWFASRDALDEQALVVEGISKPLSRR